MASNSDHESKGEGEEEQQDLQKVVDGFWSDMANEVRNIGPNVFKHQDLPLARIKKIMKLDEDVKMISAEAPVLFAKAAELFIRELTARSWHHTQDSKRRTLQRNDIAAAITKCDQFDFLIDIVPREDLKPAKRQEETQRSGVLNDPVQYFFQVASQGGQTPQQPQQTECDERLISGPGFIQIQTSNGQIQNIPVVTLGQQGVQNQLIQMPSNNAPSTSGNQGSMPSIQVIQQVVGPNGEVQNVQLTVPLTPQNLEMIQAQLNKHQQQQGQSQTTQNGETLLLQTGEDQQEVGL